MIDCGDRIGGRSATSREIASGEEDLRTEPLRRDTDARQAFCRGPAPPGDLELVAAMRLAPPRDRER